MLEVYFGCYNGSVSDIDLFFFNMYEDSWLSDILVQRMIKDIDNCDVVNNVYLRHSGGKYIPPEYLSSEVKVLICLYKCNDFLIDLSICSKVSEKWILEISKIKKTKAVVSGCNLTFKDLDINAVCLNDNTQIKDSKEWVLKMCEFVGGFIDV